MGEVRYMISEAAKKLQVESHVLRYWEDELGLEIGRTDMGHRYYTEEDIQLFLCIQKLKNEGMLLRDLKFMIPELTAARKRLNAAKVDKGAASGKTDGNAAEIRSEGQDGDAAEIHSGGQDGDAAEIRSGGQDRDTAKIRSGGQDGDAAKIRSGGQGVDTAKIHSGGQDGNAAGIRSGTPEAHAGKKLSGAAEEPAGSSLLQADTPDGPAARDSASLTSPCPAAPEADVVQVTQLEQVRTLIGDVLTDVVTSNNETLKKDISRKVTADVIREMDFLFQANERREEEHYRKLDVLIRQQQAGRREAAKETPLGKLKKLLT